MSLPSSPSRAFIAANPHLYGHLSPPQIPDAQPERHEAAALGRAEPGKAQGMERTCIRFVGRRVRPLDPDNFAASVKDLLDGLRHAGAITGDEPWRIILETEQEKVSSYKDEETLITITYP